MLVSICEDNQTTAKRIQQLAEKELKKYDIPWRTKIFVNGQEFLEAEKFEEEELIFLDIAMPKVDGIEVAGKLMENGRNENVVFVTKSPTTSSTGGLILAL